MSPNAEPGRQQLQHSHLGKQGDVKVDTLSGCLQRPVGTRQDPHGVTGGTGMRGHLLMSPGDDTSDAPAWETGQ